MPKIAEVHAAIAQMQAIRSELPDVEDKDARRGLPQKIYESLSAFANRRGGGLIVLGLEDSTFRPVGGLNVAQLQADLASLVDQRMSYPIRLDFLACDIDGSTVLAVAVPECPQPSKPVYYKHRGLIGGSYLRVPNTNHLLSEAEVRAILRSSERDDADSQPVPGADVDDLSPALIAGYRTALATRTPGSARLALDDTDLLQAATAVARIGGRLVPTVAGLLFFLEHPQRWLPATFISFLQFPGTEVAGRELPGEAHPDLHRQRPYRRSLAVCRRRVPAGH